MDQHIRSGDIDQPTVIVMNPPFSNAANSNKKNMTVGAGHVEQALKLMAPGGRLVAIVGGKGRFGDSKSMIQWLRDLNGKYHVRGIADVSGDVYKKYGTTFGTRVLVIDKPLSTDVVGVTKPKIGTVQTVGELITFFKEIRNERGEASVEPSGAGVPTGTTGVRGGQDGPKPAGPRPTDVVPPTTGQPDETGGQKGPVRGTKPAGQPTDSRGPKRPSKRRTTQTGRKPDGGRDVAGVEPSEGPDVVETEIEAVFGKKDFKRKVKSSESIFDDYVPAKLEIPGAKPHPTKLVESASMASVEPPNIT